MDRALIAAKLKAFGTHLAVSVAVFAVVIWILVTAWYPPPYFWIDGGLAMIALAAAVDMVVGPLLTLSFYRPGRRDNAFNLAVIACVQVAALGWGVHVLHSQRPLFAAFIGGPVGSFLPVTEALIRDAKRPRGELEALSRERPPLVFIPLATDPEKQRGMLMSGMLGGPSLLSATYLWLPIEGRALDTLAAASRSRASINDQDPQGLERVDAFLAERGAKFEDFIFVPLRGRYRGALLALARGDGRLAGTVYINVRD